MTTNQNVIPNQVPHSDLVSYNESVSDNTTYVAAVIYNMNKDYWEKKITIGDGNNYIYNGVTYYNAPLKKGFTHYLFLRAYSFNNIETVSK